PAPQLQRTNPGDQTRRSLTSPCVFRVFVLSCFRDSPGFFDSRDQERRTVGEPLAEDHIMPVDAKRVQAVFLAVVEVADAAQRAALLDRECAANPELRQRVEAL